LRQTGDCEIVFPCAHRGFIALYLDVCPVIQEYYITRQLSMWRVFL